MRSFREHCLQGVGGELGVFGGDGDFFLVGFLYFVGGLEDEASEAARLVLVTA